MMKYQQPRKPHMSKQAYSANNARLQQLQQQQLLQQQQQQQQQQQAKRNFYGSIANVNSFHDEVEVANFKQVLSQRFMQNQELMEVILEKNITLANIVPPSPFPDAKEYNPELPYSIWVGNLSKVEEMLKKNQEECEILEKQEESIFDEKYYKQSKMIKNLRELNFSNLDEVDNSINNLISDVATNSNNKTIIKESRFVQKSINKIKPDNVAIAPEGWYEKYQANLLRKQVELEELQKKRQNELYQQQQQQQQQQRNFQAPNPIMMPNNGLQPMSGFGYDANINNDVFNGDIPGFMDDNDFPSGLDDNDFLSQIDHSME